MKKALIFSSIVAYVIVSSSSCSNKQAVAENVAVVRTTADNLKALTAANNRFYAALNEMFTGNVQPMINVWSHESDVTQLGPFGDCLKGWDAVGAEWTRESQLKLDGKVVCKDLQVFPGDDLGFTVCTEVGENMSADGKPVEVKFRATNIFRLEHGEWKLMHHHTDISTSLQAATFAGKN